MAARVLLGNPDGVEPDSNAHSVSSGRGVPTSCTRRRSPLRSIAQSSGGGILCADISHPKFRAPTFYIRISHSRMGEEDVSTSPSDISGSSNSIHLESIVGRHFRLPGFCTVPWCSPEASRLGTRIFHVRPYSIGETRFLFICEKLIFEKKVGVATYFIFIFEGKIKQEIKP